MNSHHFHLFWIIAVAFLTGCAAPQTSRRAPVEERGVVDNHATIAKVGKPVAESLKRIPRKATNTENYIVQKGDTLFSIAFSHGLDYREVVELNKIDDPSLIKIGQQLRLPQDTARETSRTPVLAGNASGSVLKTQPQVEKIPYSDKSFAQAQNVQNQGENAKPKLLVNTDGEEETLDWCVPANGSVVADFSESANRKGVDIAGKLGTPVLASAAGKVVYSGNGLRGYGKLVIIKHNKMYLSAYAHNDQILVKEGQFVSKGQKIAEMGNTDADQVKLHFEIRKLGKPVDPAQYLAALKS